MPAPKGGPRPLFRVIYRKLDGAWDAIPPILLDSVAQADAKRAQDHAGFLALIIPAEDFVELPATGSDGSAEYPTARRFEP